MTLTQAKSRDFPMGTLIAAMATIGACDVAFGLTFQLLPLILEKSGHPAWLIGLNAAMGPLGILLGGPYLPRLIARFGGKAVSYVAMSTILACLVLLPAFGPLVAWFILRFMLGLATGSLFTVSETWMLTIADESNRGRIMGLYTSMLSVTFGIGPMILPFTGIDGWLPWLICMGFVAAGFVPMLFVNVKEVVDGGEKGSFRHVFTTAPLIFACIAAATLFDSVMISFFTIFAIRRGVEFAAASQILGLGIIIGVFFYYPLGLWADRWSKSGVIIVCTVLTIAASLAMIPFVTTILIWPIAVVLCCAAFGVYVVALALIGDVFKGLDMVAASAAVAAMWGFGGIIGPPAAGFFIDNFGINAFPATLAGFYFLLLTGLAFSGWRVAPRLRAVIK